MAGENGVFIPIIIDVEGAFEDAAQRVDKAIEPLMAKMSKHALNLKFNIDENSKRSVKTLLTDSALSAEQLEKALASIRDRIMEMKAKGGFNMAEGLKEDERELIQVFSIVAQKYQGTGLLLKSLMDDAERFAKVNAESAREVTEYWSKIDSIINSTGNSITELSMKLKAGMEKLQITPAKLDDGSSNPAYDELLTKIKEWQKSLYQYRLTLKDAVSGERERIEVLEEEEQSMRILNMQMSEWRKILENAPVGGEEFAEAARNIQALANEIADANYQFKMLSTNEGSIKRVSAEIAELNRKWSEASQDRKFNSDGTLTAWAEKQVAEMKNLTEYSEKYGMSLEQIIAKRKELKAHEDALHNIGTSMSTLNQNLAAWRKELDSAQIDSPEWETAARMVAMLSQKIKEAGDRIQELGLKSGSIEALNAKVQSLVNQWNQLSNRFGADGRMTSEARAIYDQFVKANKELQKEGQNMATILQKQEALTQKLREEDRIRRRNQLVLSSEANTIDRIREKIQLLTERLGKVKIGSGQFTKIAAEIDVLNKKLAEAQGKTKELNAESTKTNTLLGNLLRKSLYLFGLHTITRFIQNIRQVTAEFELQQVALGAIIQDTEKAADLFKKIKAAAVQSPFEIKDLVSYTKQLAAYQIESDKLFDTMMKLADISAGLGVDMQRLILAYGQVRAASVLRGQELRQFTEAGIPLVEKLAEKFTELRGEAVTTGEVFQLISERAVSFEMVAEIFDDMTEAGGIFYKMQEKQALTLAGQWANLKDSISIMYDEMGRTGPVHDAMIALINVAKSVTSNWKKWWAEIKGVTMAIVAYKIAANAAIVVTNLNKKITALASAEESKREGGIRRTITAIIGKTAAEKISTKATSLHTAAMARAAAATNGLAAAFWRLTAAMASNPFGMIAVAVSLLIGLFFKLSTETENLEDRINADAKAVEQFKKTTGETKKMIDRYDELQKQTEKTSDEQRELASTSQRLAKIFPQAARGVDEETGAVTLLVDKMRELNEEEEKAERRGLQSALKNRQKELDNITKQYDAIVKKLEEGKETYTMVSPGGAIPVKANLTDKRAEALLNQMNDLHEKKEQLIKDIKEIQDALNGVVEETPTNDTQLTKWQEKLISFKKELTEGPGKGSRVQIFGEDQVKQFSRLSDALEEAAKEYKKYDTQVKELEPAVEKLTGKEKEEIQAQLDRATTARDLAKAILEYYGALFLLDKKTTTGYTQDPFIKQMQDRMKFMQDFKKGYDNLSKYINKSGALGQEAGNMLNRGLSLGIDPAQQKRAAEDLSKWYQDAMDEVFKQAQKKGAGNDMTAFLSKQITGNSNKAKALRDFQQLLQSLWDAKTDFDTTQMTKNFDNAFKKMKDELKQSETVKKFYDDILSMTGDSDLATTLTVSVYGNVGQDFKERMQSQLNEAFASLGDDAKTPDMKAAIESQDFGYILDNLEAFPEEWRDVLKDMAKDSQKHYADMMMDIVKAYEKAKDYDERRSDVAQREAQRRVEIEEWYNKELERIRKAEEKGEITAEEATTQRTKAKTTRDTYTEASKTQEAKDTAAIDVEQLKNTYEWTKAFEDLDRVGNKTLADLAVKIQEIIDKEGNLLTPEQLKAMAEALEKVKETQASRDPIQAMSTGMQGAQVAKQGMAAIASGDPAAIQKAKQAIDAFNKSAKGVMKLDFDHLEDGFRDANKQIEKGIEGMGDYINAWSQLAGGLQTIRDYMGEVFDIEEIPIVDEVLNGVTDSLSFIAAIMPVLITLNAVLNGTLMMNPFIAMAAAIIATIGAVVGLIKGIINAKVEKINNKIEEQDKIIKNLEKDYEALDRAIAKAFGSDYISTYNQQLKVLEAEAAAYREQARLERSKGKKADEEAAQGYEEEAEKMEQKIEEMRSQVSEFMTDSDVTSAAKSFAESWIDAYKQFAFTASSIKENFKEMIDSMVVNSLAAKIIQGILQPIFDDIDRLAQEGEELSEQDIAKIAAETEVATEKIDSAMQSLMQRLAAAGINMRASGSDLSGIAKDIAGASEQSINGLAAGINTQNFYMSFVPSISSDVAAILEAITGGGGSNSPAARAAAAASSGGGSSFGDETFRNQMERIDENIAEVRSMLKSVITPKNANISTHAVVTK